MNKLLFGTLFILFALTATAQKIYFIYIQSENAQPFYVRMNEKVSSSTASGYLILSKLVDSTYRFELGFPGGQSASYHFSVTMDKRDQGFLLKNFGEKGWGLFNLQTLAVLMGEKVAAPAKEKQVAYNTGDAVSPFAALLAKASDDPSLAFRPASVTEDTRLSGPAATEPPAIVVAPVVKEETPIKKKEESAPLKTSIAVAEPRSQEVIQPASTVVTPKEEPNIIAADSRPIPQPKEEAFIPARVRKYGESSTTEGFGLVFIDQYGNDNTDTIRILIPNAQQVAPLLTGPGRSEPIRFIENIEASASEGTTVNAATNANDSVVVRSSPCKREAGKDDFFILRKQMVAADGDSAMIEAALTYYREACFHTMQLRFLGALFLTEEGRFRFFEKSRAYVNDKDQFATLSAEFKEETWRNRFLTLLNQ